jgi:hypothetical protein
MACARLSQHVRSSCLSLFFSEACGSRAGSNKTHISERELAQDSALVALRITQSHCTRRPRSGGGGRTLCLCRSSRKCKRILFFSLTYGGASSVCSHPEVSGDILVDGRLNPGHLLQVDHTVYPGPFEFLKRSSPCSSTKGSRLAFIPLMFMRAAM